MFVKKVFILFFLLLLFFGCNNTDENCIFIGKNKICLQPNDEIISINTGYYNVLLKNSDLLYFEGISQTGGIDLEKALILARIDAALKMKDFLGIDIKSENGEITLNYGDIKHLSYDLIYLLNRSLEYIVFRRNRGNFYEIHTILFFIPSLKRFVPIYEDDFSRKIWKLSNHF
nr:MULTISPECIES: hypothetical protein [unclassified Thermosipho (in: thermotogales)]